MTNVPVAKIYVTRTPSAPTPSEDTCAPVSLATWETAPSAEVISCPGTSLQTHWHPPIRTGTFFFSDAGWSSALSHRGRSGSRLLHVALTGSSCCRDDANWCWTSFSLFFSSHVALPSLTAHFWPGAPLRRFTQLVLQGGRRVEMSQRGPYSPSHTLVAEGLPPAH